MKPIYWIHVFFILLSSCYEESDYLPTKIDLENMLSLSTIDSVIVADGESSTYVVAEIPLGTRSDRTTVTFVTTKGMFENTAKSVTKAATIQAVDGQNRRIAKVKIFSTTKIEKATIEASIGDLTKSTEIRFASPNYDTYLQLTSSSPSILADGVTSAQIEVEQPIDIKDEFIPITFTTTKGMFENGTKTITKSSIIVQNGDQYIRKAIVQLTSTTQIGEAQIEATIKNTSKKITVNFEKAFPEDIQLIANALSLTPGFSNSVTLTTTLLREKGIPSAGHEATLQVYDKNGNEIGYFLNLASTSDLNGNLTNKFTLGNQSYSGNLIVRATTKDGNEIILSKEITLIVP